MLISQEITLFGAVLNILRENIEGYYDVLIREAIDNFVSISFEKKDSTLQKQFLDWALGCFFD